MGDYELMYRPATGRGHAVLALFIALSSGVGPRLVAGEDRWPDVLKDAQATSRSTLQHGRAKLELEYLNSTLKSPLFAQAEVAWSAESSLMRFWVSNPEKVGIGRNDSDVSLEHKAWDIRLTTDEASLFYNSTQKILVVQPAGVPQISALLNLQPRLQWLTCCPPGQGKLWSELINGFSPYRDSKFEYLKVGSKTVRQRRHDPGHGVGEIDFDLELGGNVVASRYLLSGTDAPVAKGAYTWRRLGELFVPSSLTYDNQVRTAEGMAYTEHTSLIVKELDLRPEPASTFTRLTFEKTLPADTTVDDRIKQTRHPLQPGASKLPDAQLKQLSERLKARGFLNK